MSRRAASTAAIFAVTALTIVGCSTSEGDTLLSPQDRPTLETVAAEFTEAEERIHAAVSEILPDGTWTRSKEPRTSPCTENGETVDNAKRLYHGTWGFDAVPDDAQWNQIREQIMPILNHYGYAEIIMDTPVADGAALEVAGTYEGSSFSIEYNKATAMGFRSGCHFPEALKE